MSSDPAPEEWATSSFKGRARRSVHAAGRPAGEAGTARSKETAAKAAWPIPTTKARNGEQHCMSSCAGRSQCQEQMGLKSSLGTRWLSCIFWCRSAFAGEVPVCKLEKGTIWDYSEKSNEKARENARETWDLAENEKDLGSPRAPIR